MLSLVTRKQRPALERPAPDLLSKLTWLRGFVTPRIHSFDDGTWGARIKMNTKAAGAQFEIKSDYLTCPGQAVDQLIERMRAVLEESPA